MTPSAEEIFDLANADPQRSMELGRRLLESTEIGPQDRALVLRAMSTASRLLGELGKAIELADEARDIAKRAGDGSEQLLATLMKVSHMSASGRTDEALGLIDESEHLADTAYLSARSSYQRGVTLMMKGETPRAIDAYESALPALREAGDQLIVRSALQGLGSLRVATGDLEQAERDLTEALEIAIERDEQPAISGIKQHLGRLAAYRGDITEALALLLDGDEIYMRLTGSSAPQHVMRCEVLLSAGLFREAHRLAREIVARHRAIEDAEHLAEALLVAAQAALHSGDVEDARDTAREAAELLGRQERPGLAVRARRIVLEARYELEGPSRELLRAAAEIARQLDSERLLVSATQARLLMGRIAIELGDESTALETLEPVTEVTKGPVELRIQSRLAQALCRQINADGQGADAAARSGLRLIDEYQSALGATDLRMGIEQHGVELGSIGLGLAIDSGRPRRVLRWMERTRARALRYRPVIPEADDDVQAALVKLRYVESELRQSRNDVNLQRERRRLQERVRAADRRRRATTTSDQRFDLPSLIRELGDRVLYEVAVHDGRLIGVVLEQGRSRMVELGDEASVMRELGHVRFGMRRAALRGRPFDAHSLESLDEALFGDLRLDTGELVVVPPPGLMAVPWSALPSVQRVSVTVSPSAEIWWRARQREPGSDSVLVVGGPDLENAQSEVAAVGALYEEATVLPPGTGVEVVRSALAGHRIVHIASHATFQVENPMFSSLRLGDGDLNVYDIERLGHPPQIVVLSACDSGYTEAGAGDELAGLTSALLSMGTRSVVASVGLVPDSPGTSALMINFHEGLTAGLAPAIALSRAQSAIRDDPEGFVAAASFVCVGA